MTTMAKILIIMLQASIRVVRNRFRRLPITGVSRFIALDPFHAKSSWPNGLGHAVHLPALVQAQDRALGHDGQIAVSAPWPIIDSPVNRPGRPIIIAQFCGQVPPREHGSTPERFRIGAGIGVDEKQRLLTAGKPSHARVGHRAEQIAAGSLILPAGDAIGTDEAVSSMLFRLVADVQHDAAVRQFDQHGLARIRRLGVVAGKRTAAPCLTAVITEDRRHARVAMVTGARVRKQDRD